MKRCIFIIAAALCIGAVTAGDAFAQRSVTASGTYVVREVTGVGNFHEIRNSSSVDVEYRQGREVTAEIYGSENLLQYVRLNNRGGVLEVELDRGVNIRGERRLKVILSSPELRAVTATGAGDIKIESSLEADKFEMIVSGAGDIKFHGIKAREITVNVSGAGDVEGYRAECDRLLVGVRGAGDIEIDGIRAGTVDVSVAGSGDVELTGTADLAVLKVTGAGDIDAESLRARRVEALVSGAGDISCFPDESLHATASGAGTIEYKGNPREVDIKGNARRVKRD